MLMNNSPQFAQHTADSLPKPSQPSPMSTYQKTFPFLPFYR